jgi:hypothetical protein
MTLVALKGAPVRGRTVLLLHGAVFLIVAFVAWWASAPYVVGVYHDDGDYALLAKSIATGHGFRVIGLPGDPASIHRPPIYPLLLAATWRVAPFPDNLWVLLSLNAILLGLAALGLYRFATDRLGWRHETAAACAIASTITAASLALSSTMLSEPLFLAALWPALMLADRAVTADDSRSVAIAGGAVGLLVLVRTHAIALLVAIVIVLLVRRRPAHAALAAAVAILVLAPWQLWTAHATPRIPTPLEGAYGSYAGWYVRGLRDGGIPFLLATARTNVREFWLLLVDRVAIGTVAWIWWTIAGIVAVLIAIGAWKVAKQSLVSVVFLACYLGIVLLWPYIPWRFVWAVWPLVLLLAAEGAWWAVDSLGPSRVRGAMLAVAVIPAAAMLGTEWNAYAHRSWLRPAQQAGDQVKPVVRWVLTHTRPDDVVLTEAAEVVTLFTGRRAAPTASFTAREYLAPTDSIRSRNELRAMLGVVPARYVVALLPATQQAARSLAAAPQPALREIGALPQAQALIFEVVR